MPALSLPATSGDALTWRKQPAARWSSTCYPRTGRPGEPLPEGWNEIPGARGCTPQSCAFRDHFGELRTLGADVLGMSAQPLPDQIEFAERVELPYPILSDPELALADALAPPHLRGRRHAPLPPADSGRAGRGESSRPSTRSSRRTGTPPTSWPGSRDRSLSERASPVFYYDLGSPYAYLAAERVNAPVRRGRGRAARVAADSARRPVQAVRPRLVGQRPRPRRGDARGRAPARRPTGCPRSAGPTRGRRTHSSRCGWPPSRRRSAGRVSFSLAAFRQAFAAGRDLERSRQRPARRGGGRDPPARLARGGRARLGQERAARGNGPRGRPRRPRRPGRGRGREVFWGDDRLEEAAAAAARL